MRHIFRRYLPTYHTIQQNRWIQPFSAWLHHPNLWHLNRHSVSGGVAVGMFCGLIPGPLQMVSAMIVSVLFRVNLPTALFTTLYTNPLTILPLYLAAYEVGVFVSGAPSLPLASLPELSWRNGLNELWLWLLSMGKPLLIGLPLLALALSILGYLMVSVSWRLMVQLRWQRRQKTGNIKCLSMSSIMVIRYTHTTILLIIHSICV